MAAGPTLGCGVAGERARIGGAAMASDGLRRFSRAELKQFDGRDGRPIYAAYQGSVYDVTASPLWGEGQHFEHLAGADLTEELADAPHGEEVFEDFPVVGHLAD